MSAAIRTEEKLPPPQPSEVDEAGNLPESSPGSENKLPEQPAPEPTSPEDLGKVMTTEKRHTWSALVLLGCIFAQLFMHGRLQPVDV